MSEKPGSDSGEHAQTAAVERLFEAIEASTKAQNLGTSMTRRVFWMLAAMAVLFSCFSLYSGAQAERAQARQEALAAQLEAMRAQVSTVQDTANATQTSVAVIEERPFPDVVEAPASASGGAAQPTALYVLRKTRPSTSSQTRDVVIAPIPLIPSAPSAAPSEKKK